MSPGNNHFGERFSSARDNRNGNGLELPWPDGTKNREKKEKKDGPK